MQAALLVNLDTTALCLGNALLCFAFCIAMGQVCNGVSSAICSNIDSQLGARAESQNQNRKPANMCCHMLQQQQQQQQHMHTTATVAVAVGQLPHCLFGYSNCAQAQQLLVTLQTFQLPSNWRLVLATLRLLHTNAAEYSANSLW